MPTISQRGRTMPPSPIRKLAPYADAAKMRGVNVYHLNIGQPDIETPKGMWDALSQRRMEVLEYGPSNGYESYRRKLCTYYQRQGVQLDSSQIIVTTGGSEAILFAIMSCLDPGDELLTPEPYYANYQGFAIEAMVEVTTVSSRLEDGFALPGIETFERQITARTKAILICNPNNPTGYLYTRKELEQLRDLCLRHDLYLFVDEAYREFCYEGVHTSVLSLEGLEDRAVLLDTISKRYSACGARIGALVSRNAGLIETVLKFSQARLCPPTLEQVLGEAAVDLPLDYFDSTRKEYKERRDYLVGRLRAMPGVECPMPGGAFYALASLPVDDSERFCQWLLESFQHEGQTLMLAPASGFYHHAELGRSQVRLAYVLNKEALAKAMDCLGLALIAYPGKTG